MAGNGIHILDNATEDIVLYMTNTAKEIMVLSNIHTRSADDHSETFDFSIPYKYTKHLANQNRVLIPDDINNRYREFVIKNVETDNDTIFVQSDAAWLDDLNRNTKPMAPMNYQNITLDEAMDIVLIGSGYKKGKVDFDSFIDLVTTEYKTAYDLLLMLEELSDLQFVTYITTDGNTITGRYVALEERREFEGKELVRGHNVTGIKKKENTRELVTALILTSTDEKDRPLVTEVTDDKARDRWGNNGKFSWSIHHIEAKPEDKMTTAKMKLKGAKVLKNMIDSTVEYEVTAIEIHKQLKQQARYGDRIRVRDVVYQPHFYLEATVKSVSRDVFDENSKEFTLGEIKQYSEQDLRKFFNSLRAELTIKMNDNINNIDTIVGQISETVAKNDIHKAETAPNEPPTNKLWLDTSTQPAILKRWNGTQWIIDSPTKPSDVGAIPKEIAMIESLAAVYKNITAQFVNLQNESSLLIQSEHLVDTILKDKLVTDLDNASNEFIRLGNLIQEKQKISRPLMSDVLEVQMALDAFNDAFVSVKEDVVKVRKAIEDRITFLQSQYTEENVAKIFQDVAAVTGLTYDAEANTLTGDINLSDANVTKVYDKVTADMKGEYVSSTTYSTDQDGIVTKLNNQQSAIEQNAKQLNLEVSDSKINTQLKTLSEAVSAIKVIANGITMTSREDGLLSTFTMDPNGIQLNADLININNGQIEVTKGVSKIKNAVINDAHIDRLTLHALSGGVLNLGGYEMKPVLNPDGTTQMQTVATDDNGTEVIPVTQAVALPDGEINFRNADNEILFQISSNNKGADKFAVNELSVRDKIKNDYIVSKDTSGATYWARGSAYGSDDNDGLTEMTAFMSVQKAVDSIPDFITQDYTIIVRPTTDPEHVVVSSRMGSGSITFDFQNTKNSNIRFSVESCQCKVLFKNATEIGVLDNSVSYMMRNYFSNWVEFNNVNLNGDNSSSLIGFLCYGGGNTYISQCEVQNVTDAVSATHLHNVYMFDSPGKASRYGAISWRGATININGTAPIGTTANAMKSYAGNINTTDATYPTVTVKSPTVVTTTKTKTWKATSSNYYAYSGYNKWATSGMFHYGYPIVGYGYGSPKQVGAWFFGSDMRDTLKGKNIKSIKVKLYRRANVGNSANAKVHLRMHTYTSQPAGAPSFSSDYKEIVMDWNESKTVDVTSIFKEEIAGGNYAGFGLKPTVQDVYHYAELSKAIEVTVIYS